MDDEQPKVITTKSERPEQRVVVIDMSRDGLHAVAPHPVAAAVREPEVLDSAGDDEDAIE